MKAWQGVVIHMTEGPDTDDLESKGYKAYHINKGWRDIGYHFVVEKIDGGVWPVVGRMLNEVGAHCRYFNTRYLGVALAGDFTKTPPDDDHLKSAARLAAGLMDICGMATEGALFPHRELNDTTCPGAAFPWERFKLMVAQARTTAGQLASVLPGQTGGPE